MAPTTSPPARSLSEKWPLEANGPSSISLGRWKNQSGYSFYATVGGHAVVVDPFSSMYRATMVKGRR